MTTIALLPEAFGFGPASKLLSIGIELVRRPGICVVGVGTGTALELLRSSGIDCVEASADQLTPAATVRLRSADAMVVGMSPAWVDSLQIFRKPIYYVDSLGFMWQRGDIPLKSSLYKVRAYFAQEIFGASKNLESLGFRNVVPTSAIVSSVPEPRTREDETASSGVVLNLGGVGNPFSGEHTTAYLELIEIIAKEIAARIGSIPIVLAGRASAEWQSSSSSLVAQFLSPSEAQHTMAAAETVVSSPGLTTLLECSQSEVGYLPLPPQNWSQLLIIRHMAKTLGDGAGLWAYLAGVYESVPLTGASEEEAMQAVSRVNREWWASPEGIQGYVDELARYLGAAIALPALGFPYSGALECAHHLLADLPLT